MKLKLFPTSIITGTLLLIISPALYLPSSLTDLECNSHITQEVNKVIVYGKDNIDLNTIFNADNDYDDGYSELFIQDKRVNDWFLKANQQYEMIFHYALNSKLSNERNK